VIDLGFVSQFVESQYGLPSVRLSPLHQFAYDWRGVYRVDDGDGRSWVLRLLRHQEAEQWLARPAALLQWLSQQEYPAPRLLPSRAGDALSAHEGWWGLMTTFIAGEPIERTPSQLRWVGEAAGRLHRVAPPPQESGALLAVSRLHPCQALAAAFPSPDAAARGLPSGLRPLYTGLCRTLAKVRARCDLPCCLVHGDCWYANAIHTAPGRVRFIDWDNGGCGAAILELGYLLLTSHYDPERPTTLRASRAVIGAILEGYCRCREVTPGERDVLLEAVRFPLAMDGAAYLAGSREIDVEQFTLRKLQARYAATEAIARIAAGWLDGGASGQGVRRGKHVGVAERTRPTNDNEAIRASPAYPGSTDEVH
jgi:Ser/Thr protein kinase RdoA (MazF antagonist)